MTIYHHRNQQMATKVSHVSRICLSLLTALWILEKEDKGKKNEDSKNSSTSAHNMCVDVALID
jgi:hypothetical protein